MKEKTRSYTKRKHLADFMIWILLLAGVVFMAICPPIGFALIGCVLVA